MDFTLDDDQRAFASSVKELLADRFATATRAAYEDADGDGHPDKLWDAMGQQGWLAITVPEQVGGLGLGLVDAQIVARGLGGAAIPGPWLDSTLAVEAIRLAGGESQHQTWLPGLGSGETIGTHALDQHVRIDGGVATGRLVRVGYAQIADVLIVADATGAIGVVDLHGAGVSITAQRQYDLSTRLAVVELDGAPVTLLARASSDVLADLVQRATVLAAADLAAIARASVARTVEYDSQRVQFGRPVGSFQALKHELANLHVAVTMAEEAVLYAAHAIDAGLPDAALAVAVAKSKASATAKLASAAMIQFHGGIGFTWEHDAHFYFKRAKRLGAAFGDAEFHRERIVQLLMDGDA